MRELQFLIRDVREATDNQDANGVKDKEIIRYFNDAIRSIQALVFKNNPLCSYFQTSTAIASPVGGATHVLPTDTYGDNAVSFVEINSDGSSDSYTPLDRCWPEDQNSFMGWFTRNRAIVFSGSNSSSNNFAARVWYFQRLPRWDKAWATISGVVGQVMTIVVLDADFSTVDNYLSVYTAAGVLRKADLKFVVTSATTLTIVGDLTGIVATDVIVMGKNTVLAIDLPEDVETYMVDYVSKRVSARNNYGDASKLDWFTSETKADIISIFNDIGQAQLRAPITDTDYMRL